MPIKEKILQMHSLQQAIERLCEQSKMDVKAQRSVLITSMINFCFNKDFPAEDFEKIMLEMIEEYNIIWNEFHEH